MTINEIIQRVKTICQSHQMVRSFFFGNPSDFLVNVKQRDYVAILLQDAGGAFSPSGNEYTLSFKMFVLDLVHVATDMKTNELDVQSDCLSIGNDLMSLINSHQYDDWALATSVSYSLVAEKFEDMLGGVVIDFTIRTQWDKSYCEAPIN